MLDLLDAGYSKVILAPPTVGVDYDGTSGKHDRDDGSDGNRNHNSKTSDNSADECPIAQQAKLSSRAARSPPACLPW